MKKKRINPYTRFRDRSLTLNDYLAIDRTILSNERTLLAYSRTALAQIIIGGSALKFFDSAALVIVGWLFLLSGVITMLIGWRSYRHTDQLLRVALESQTGEGEHPLEEILVQAEEKARAAKIAEKQGSD
jgi:putative membrane protein